MEKLHLKAWQHYQKLVLNELERLREQHDALQSQQQNILIEIYMLKVRSGVWGLMGGLIPSPRRPLIDIPKKIRNTLNSRVNIKING